jgi:hypothetical protein
MQSSDDGCHKEVRFHKRPPWSSIYHGLMVNRLYNAEQSGVIVCVLLFLLSQWKKFLARDFTVFHGIDSHL